MLAAARLLPEEVVEAFAVYGTAQECARRLREIRACGANQLAFVVLPGAGMTWEEVAMRIAREVLPQVASDGVAAEGSGGRSA